MHVRPEPRIACVYGRRTHACTHYCAEEDIRLEAPEVTDAAVGVAVCMLPHRQRGVEPAAHEAEERGECGGEQRVGG